jgi:hypothetical protein
MLQPRDLENYRPMLHSKQMQQPQLCQTNSTLWKVSRQAIRFSLKNQTLDHFLLKDARLGRTNRKRALSASPYPDLDLSALIRYSPTSLHFLNGSPGSSGSYGHLSTGWLKL